MIKDKDFWKKVSKSLSISEELNERAKVAKEINDRDYKRFQNDLLYKEESARELRNALVKGPEVLHKISKKHDEQIKQNSESIFNQNVQIELTKIEIERAIKESKSSIKIAIVSIIISVLSILISTYFSLK